ncbi:M14 family metallopeptidase [Streptomyces sp. Da 82-17]|uniref:M14 family metallopeptidase n=1 Tax=Streptomyces sp. Da 82-17 TaxID=3377116 RepID=UPI0038D3D4D2
MRLRVRSKRGAAVAALIAVAIAAPLTANAAPTGDDPNPKAAASASSDDQRIRQYEIHGPSTAADRTRIASSGVSVDEARDHSVVVSATAAQAELLRGQGHELKALPGPPKRLGGKAAEPKDFPAEDAKYHTYDEMNAVIDEQIKAHPDLISKKVIGKSHEGRDIIAVKVSDKVAEDEAEPEVLFTHHQHAREHLTVEMALYLVKTFGDGYGSDDRVTKMLNEREVWIVPDVNPDGGEYDIKTGEYQSWRLNRQPNEGAATGTDLNRNWAYKWGCCGGSSDEPGSETYRGAKAESAPETKVVADFVRGRVVDGKQQIKAAIDFHTYSELVLWPYGYTTDDTAEGLTQDDRDAHAAIGEKMAESNGYTPQQSSDLYVTDGSIDDWLWGDQKIFSYTFEMYPSSQGDGGFYPPDEVIEKETSRNKDAVLQLLENADCMYRSIGKEEQYCKA